MHTERPMPPPLPITRVVTPSTVSPTPDFRATRLDPAILRDDASPLMSVDHFVMRAPTFPPHPHAGFSAVTYVLPESAGAMLNRDSRGDHSRIAPGGLHWTAAGAGIVHEEVPERRGVPVEGFQIFIKQPREAELAPPAVQHVEPAEVPDVDAGEGARVRVLAGSHRGHAAPVVPPSPFLALDVMLAPAATFRWASPDADRASVAYLFRGSALVNGTSVGSPAMIALGRGAGSLTALAGGEGARIALFSGRPLDGPIHWQGPFALSSPAALRSAFERYQAGEMGRL
jgi:hypothetical protein